MFAKNIEISPPFSAKMAKCNEPCPRLLLAFVFSTDGFISFDKEETVANVSEVGHGRHEVGRLLSVVGDEAKKLSNALAISCVY